MDPKISMYVCSLRSSGADHPNKEPWLLCITSDTGVANDSNCKTSRKTSKTNRETSTELDKTLEERHLRRDCGMQVSANNKT